VEQLAHDEPGRRKAAGAGLDVSERIEYTRRDHTDCPVAQCFDQLWKRILADPDIGIENAKWALRQCSNAAL
jgi:hypothetical protein